MYCTVLYCTVLYYNVLYCTVPTQGDGPGHGAYGVPRAALPDRGQVPGAGAGHHQHVHRAVRPGHVRPHLQLEHCIIIWCHQVMGKE